MALRRTWTRSVLPPLHGRPRSHRSMSGSCKGFPSWTSSLSAPLRLKLQPGRGNPIHMPKLTQDQAAKVRTVLIGSCYVVLAAIAGSTLHARKGNSRPVLSTIHAGSLDRGNDPWSACDSVAAARRLRCPNYEAANLERGCQAGACVGARRRSVEGASCRYRGLQENGCSFSHRLAGVTEGSRGPSDSRLYHYSHRRDIRCVRPGPVHCPLQPDPICGACPKVVEGTWHLLCQRHDS